MRQWVSALVILFVVAVMAAFTMGSIVAIVTAAAELRQSMDEANDLMLAESSTECDRFDVNPCQWTASSVSASALHRRDTSASAHDVTAAVGSPTETGGSMANVEP